MSGGRYSTDRRLKTDRDKSGMYIVKFSGSKPEMKGLWEGPAWQRASTMELSCFRPEGTGHRPRTLAKLLYGSAGISGIFRVEDRYVRNVHTEYMDPVYRDSCVEFFFRPGTGSGYFNFEFNCGGALLSSYITDPERTAAGFKEFIPLPREDGERVAIYHSLPKVTDPEIVRPTVWLLEFFIPLWMIEKYAGSLGRLTGSEWRANLYKCADDTSHPHWASWAPITSKNFHLPECFGRIRFE